MTVMRDALPPGCEAYRRTLEFTESTIPAGLLRSHRTAPGVWALIHVLEGRLRYRVLDPPAERVLGPSDAPGVIEPGVPHEVAPLGKVRFHVAFHRLAGPPAGKPPVLTRQGRRRKAMSRRARPSAGGSLALIWAGMVLGISFLATPAKFLAPSLPLPVALDIGRRTFRVFGRVETGLAALLGLGAPGRPLALAPGLVVLVQALWLRPRLAARTQLAVRAGAMARPSPDLHLAYVGCEAIKLAALLALGLAAARRGPRHG